MLTPTSTLYLPRHRGHPNYRARVALCSEVQTPTSPTPWSPRQGLELSARTYNALMGRWALASISQTCLTPGHANIYPPGDRVTPENE